MIRAILLIAIGGLLRAETGRFTLHMILHAIGSEQYEIAAADGGLTLTANSEYADRGMSRTTSAVLRMKADYSAGVLEVKGAPGHGFQPPNHRLRFPAPQPFAVQMALMRYWAKWSLKPKRGLQPYRADGSLSSCAGSESITAAGKQVPLDRYTIDGLMFGREIVWMDAQQNLAAAMTFAGGLPMEAARARRAPQFPLPCNSIRAESRRKWPIWKRSGQTSPAGAQRLLRHRRLPR